MLIERVRIEPFNAIATLIFALAIAHTFAAVRFSRHASRVQQAHDERSRAAGKPPTPSVAAELLHFLGEIEAVFGLWAVVLVAAMVAYAGWETATHYFNEITYTEPLFVVVIMALASTRPIITFAEQSLRLHCQHRWIYSGGVVADDFDDWPSPRLLHHRACRHDHLRVAAGEAVLRPWAQR